MQVACNCIVSCPSKYFFSHGRFLHGLGPFRSVGQHLWMVRPGMRGKSQSRPSSRGFPVPQFVKLISSLSPDRLMVDISTAQGVYNALQWSMFGRASMECSFFTFGIHENQGLGVYSHIHKNFVNLQTFGLFYFALLFAQAYWELMARLEALESSG